MIDINKNRTSPKKANSIRTNLLLTINKEIISQEKQNKNNNFLINSRNTQTYSNGFDNYVIVERDEDVVVYDTFNIDRAVEFLHKLLMDNIGTDVAYIVKTMNYKGNE